MAKYVMVVQSRAKQGRDAEYLQWYDRDHFGDICVLPGIVGGRRFELESSAYGEPGERYLSIFDIETDDLDQLRAEMARRSAAGEVSTTDSLDRESPVMWFYKEREPVA